MEPLYSIMAQCLEAMRNCRIDDNSEWYDVWQEVLNDCVKYLPRGGGFDDNPVLDEEASSCDKLAFVGAYHQMNDVGYYTGWINYRVVVKPSFSTGIKVVVRYVRDETLREYIADCFNDALHEKHNRNEMIMAVRKEITSCTETAQR